jgi:uncharacterized membrane protein
LWLAASSDLQRSRRRRSKTIEGAGVAVIVVGTLSATVIAGTRARWAKLICTGVTGSSFGRSILLGLELLVAADIIRTVAVTPTLTSVAVLGGIVLIRTFLSFSLELEISGRRPWQKPDLPPPRTEGR